MQFDILGFSHLLLSPEYLLEGVKGGFFCFSPDHIHGLAQHTQTNNTTEKAVLQRVCENEQASEEKNLQQLFCQRRCRRKCYAQEKVCRFACSSWTEEQLGVFFQLLQFHPQLLLTLLCRSCLSSAQLSSALFSMAWLPPCPLQPLFLLHSLQLLLIPHAFWAATLLILDEFLIHPKIHFCCISWP